MFLSEEKTGIVEKLKEQLLAVVCHLFWSFAMQEEIFFFCDSGFQLIATICKFSL